MRQVSPIRKAISLATYTFSHFCVDFACFFMLFRGFNQHTTEPQTLALGFLVYNVIAFGIQPVIGYLYDTKPNMPAGLYGCCLVILGLCLMPFAWASLAVCALGNACFHIAGGVDSLAFASGRMSRSGIFVSSGALGVALGTISDKSAGMSVFVPLLLLALSCMLILRFGRIENTEYTDMCFHNTSLSRSFSIILLLCFVSIVIRSYVGSMIPIAWKTTIFLMVLPSLGACMGKALGGYLADCFGARNVGVASLLLSVPFFLFGNDNPIPCTAGILFFNMTMPVTLCAVANKLPTNPGLAFGVTTLGLLLGSIPASFYAMPSSLVKPVMALFILLSAACIYVAVVNQKGAFVYEKANQSAESHIV